MECCPAVMINTVRIRAGLEEQSGSRHSVGSSRVMERWPSLMITKMGVSARLQEQSHGLRSPRMRRAVEWREILRALRINVRAVREQLVHDSKLIPRSGHVERSAPLVVPWVDRAARREERSDHGGVPAQSLPVEQCASFRILLVDVHPKLREQSPNRVGMDPGAARRARDHCAALHIGPDWAVPRWG